MKNGKGKVLKNGMQQQIMKMFSKARVLNSSECLATTQDEQNKVGKNYRAPPKRLFRNSIQLFARIYYGIRRLQKL